jgi:hypothetical protein
MYPNWNLSFENISSGSPVTNSSGHPDFGYENSTPALHPQKKLAIVASPSLGTETGGGGRGLKIPFDSKQLLKLLKRFNNSIYFFSPSQKEGSLKTTPRTKTFSCSIPCQGG